MTASKTISANVYRHGAHTLHPQLPSARTQKSLPNRPHGSTARARHIISSSSSNYLACVLLATRREWGCLRCPALPEPGRIEPWGGGRPLRQRRSGCTFVTSALLPARCHYVISLCRGRAEVSLVHGAHTESFSATAMLVMSCALGWMNIVLRVK